VRPQLATRDYEFLNSQQSTGLFVTPYALCLGQKAPLMVQVLLNCIDSLPEGQQLQECKT
jgi:hypothetical protein